MVYLQATLMYMDSVDIQIDLGPQTLRQGPGIEGQSELA